ncbi:transcriptional regulator [Bradyrhizobium sp. CCBAU 051011]|uniref:helix-turn-helix domain-containing protein n=1 Tax=Bradyrhizobium sp. CCBAU 051011 TaxID=858422 RepID=UPI00137469EA|nr:helix-turn-helix domain-containing protein [Bradyrhizobium sp. CCBAU 051011]QHO74621.1 transcriptional regulator [Bradyrhizobium sp. CCBAU 051011]
MYSNAGGQKPRLIGELSAASDRISVSDFRYGRGAEIFGEAEPAEYIYQVIEGAVRTHKLLPDGRRQIGAFHLSGDIFGLENGATHRFTAEAIVATMVRLVKRKSLDNVAQNDPAIFNTILDMTTSSLVHAQNLILLLGRKTSLERVAAFLLEMHFRSTAAGVMHLPMSRRDIADYLGLTLETVSRAISELRRRLILKFEGTTQRHIVILDVQALAKLADEPDAAA